MKSVKKRIGSEQRDFSVSDDMGGESLSDDSLDDVELSSTGSPPGTEKKTLSEAEQIKALYRSRVIIAVLLSLFTAAAGGVAFWMAKRAQETYFHEQFGDAAKRLLHHVGLILNDASQAYDVMAAAMMGLAFNASWPLYTQNNFEVFGQNFLEGTLSDFVAWSPIVHGETDRQRWEDYAASHGSAWIQQGRVLQARNEGLEMPEGPFDVPHTIYTKDDKGQPLPVTGNGPFLPVWQMAGAPESSSVVNFDLLSDEIFERTFQGMMSTKTQSFSRIIPDASFYYGASAQSKDSLGYAHDGTPQGFLMTPLIRQSPSAEGDVVGVIVAVLSWGTRFQEALMEDTPKVFVVVDDRQSGDTFTLTITGHDIRYDGEGATHDPRYSNLGHSLTFTSSEDINYVDCEYTVSVYPSKAFLIKYLDKEASYWSLFVTGIIVLVALAFFGYDLYVQKRHFKSVNSAAKLNAIISSLFPEEVRDRLFGNQPEVVEDAQQVEKKSRLSNYLNNMSDVGSRRYGGSSRDAPTDGSVNAADFWEVSRRYDVAVPNVEVGVDMYQTRPIADLFPNCTIMFADIAGFTAWSSVREPSQVFTLLETVYQSFDVIAKRRKVFKVETVGDCYVAVVGLPEPRADHAVVMARFARECLDRFNELVKKLEISLGPDTADLAMRAGLHSGPVTAGVLRGDKSRFQLFGDAVNLAARVESTGVRNRIHMSVDTADLLMKAGKEHWCRKRPELVTAKGKTAIQTYWLQSPGDTDVEEPISDNPDNSTRQKEVDLANVEDSLSPKVKRLVEWNVEILKKLLQEIVAKRDAFGKKRTNEAQIAKLEVAYTKKQYLIDEVKEIISLPKFDVRAHKKKAEKAELSPQVVEQLKLYVSAIAAMHRENPFHNFEHASHVTMSVSKLMTRIVAPEEIILGEEEGANLAATLHDHTYGITSDPLTQFACVLSALIHDVDHAGVSNIQLVKERSSLAKTFKEQSMAEQNSVVKAWEKLMNPLFTDLRKCIYSDPTELDRFRQLVVNNVLATDLFDRELQSLRKKRWELAFEQRWSSGDSLNAVNRKATIVMEHLMQASDVAHTMQHWHIYQKWNERLFAEMYLAYKCGRFDSDPCEHWYQGELGFFDNYVIPLANKLKECGVFGVSSDEYLNYALENRREWANQGEDVIGRYVLKYCGDDGYKTDD